MTRQVELSAQTPRLAATPAPIGKLGGPGLWWVKGMGFPPYFQNVRNALIRAGHSKADASRITFGAMRRWAAGGGNVHPEVRAAAAAALASIKVKAGIAHAKRASRDAARGQEHAGDAVDFFELAFAEALVDRVPAGRAEGGQFSQPPALTRHATPEQQARAINGLGASERASWRASSLPPPGWDWAHGDRLTPAS